MEAIMALALVIISLAAGLADLTTPAYFETSPPTVETPPLAPLETFHSTAHIPISFPVSKLDPIMPRQATPALEPLQALQSTARIPISFPVDRFASDLPRAATPLLEPLQTRRSSILLPVSVPVQSIERELERIVAPTQSVSGSAKWLLGSVHYDLAVERSAITIGGSDERLVASTQASVTGPVGWWIFSGTLNASTQIQVAIAPAIHGDWRVSPGLALEGRVSAAKFSSMLPDIGVRRLLGKLVNDFLTQEQKKLEDSISNSDFLETIAKKGWEGLCRSFPISSDPKVWLEVKPTAVSAASPSIDDERMNTELALEFELRVVDRETKPVCGFPEVAVDESRDGGISIVLPIEITYDTLSTFLDDKVGGKSFSSDGFSVTFESLEVGPYGRAALLHTEIIVRAPGWFETPARGVIYISGEPRLDVDDQTLTFANLQLDTSSRRALVGLGLEIAEPVILDALQDVRFDLKPHLATLENMAEAALDELESSIPGVVIAATRPEILLDRIDVGREYLRLVARVTGMLSVDVQTLPWRREAATDD